MDIRPYDPESDLDAAVRIWREVGWNGMVEPEWMRRYLSCGPAFVADLDAETECLVCTAPGSVRHLDRELPLSVVTGVVTGRAGRRQGLAGRLTAHAIAQTAQAGAAVSALTIFDQGFYNKLGFGNGSYLHFARFDPAALRVPVTPRRPVRLGADDWEAVHAGRLARAHGHGACDIAAADYTWCEMQGGKTQFGLGYRDESGALTHGFWCYPEDVEDGPYRVQWTFARSHEQFLELLALLASLGDQVKLIHLEEPPALQLQDFLTMPFRHDRLTAGGKFATRIGAVAVWQMRINDLPAALAATRLRRGELRLNAALTDPIADYLPADSPWRGIGGEWIINLGAESAAVPGRDPSLPTLTASAGAFTRLWLGVRPATGLAHTDRLSGPAELLEALDEVLRLPTPYPDWPY